MSIAECILPPPIKGEGVVEDVHPDGVVEALLSCCHQTLHGVASWTGECIGCTHYLERGGWVEVGQKVKSEIITLM